MASRPSSEDGSFVEDQDVSEEEFDDGLGLAEMSEADAWAATIEAVLPAILVVKTNNTRNVDGFGAGASEATGYVMCLHFENMANEH